MRIDSSGNLGLGVTPSAWAAATVAMEFKAAGNHIWSIGSNNIYLGSNAYYDSSWKYAFTGLAATYQSAAGEHRWFNAASGTAGNAISFTQAMTLDADGDLGIGTSSPSVKLNIAAANPTDGVLSLIQNISTSGQTGALVQLDVANVGSSAVGIPGGATNALAFYVGGVTSASERARITSGGDLLVGTTTSSAKLTVDGVSSQVCIRSTVSNSGDINAQLITNQASGTAVQFYTSGTTVAGSITVNGTATAYNTSSDARLKENITDAAPASDLIDAIQVRQFDWKSDGSHQRYGMVAQELAQVAPEAVHQPADPEEMMAVDYSKLVPMLIKEIQSLRARVAALESQP
jgi:hypothetical protein